MKRYLITIIIALVAYAAFAQPNIPVKLFDVRNGNGVVDSGTTYPQAIVIPFKDKASKDAIIDAFVDQYNYQSTVPDPANPGATIPNPQSKAAFTNDRIKSFIKEVYTASNVSAATKSAATSSKATVDSVVPPE